MVGMDPSATLPAAAAVAVCSLGGQFDAEPLKAEARARPFCRPHGACGCGGCGGGTRGRGDSPTACVRTWSAVPTAGSVPALAACASAAGGPSEFPAFSFYEPLLLLRVLLGNHSF